MGIIIFEPTRSDHDDDTAGHVSDDSDSEEAGVVGEAPAVPETGVACHFVGEEETDNIFHKKTIRTPPPPAQRYGLLPNVRLADPAALLFVSFSRESVL